MWMLEIPAMVCLRGESLTYRINQMKFLSSIASAAIVGSAFVVASPASARTTTCWYGGPNQNLSPMTCKISKRTNANGHVVFDLRATDLAGIITFVFWDNNSAEIIHSTKGHRGWAEAWTDRQGDQRLRLQNGGQFSFRY